MRKILAYLSVSAVLVAGTLTFAVVTANAGEIVCPAFRPVGRTLTDMHKPLLVAAIAATAPSADASKLTSVKCVKRYVGVYDAEGARTGEVVGTVCSAEVLCPDTITAREKSDAILAGGAADCTDPKPVTMSTQAIDAWSAYLLAVHGLTIADAWGWRAVRNNPKDLSDVYGWVIPFVSRTDEEFNAAADAKKIRKPASECRRVE